ncbi:hypothetical protein [Listeria fleischmannii]|uniref:AP2 domain n=1 Tax=Listeria fleischmannii subsp. fleischmannii TaxID=1671902 RepID=A0A2X3H373_9LIST|nr:hypothetical protein [Listeria fleischmannii]SQC67333.1 Uncharacterised protein [Listeria fleischmannii subsp. fleischmannii]
MANIRDLTGLRFDRLEVLCLASQDKYYNLYWLCKCDCGTEKVIGGSGLKSGATKSCGCLNKELSRKRKVNLTHGYSNKERLYWTWKGMKARCYNTNNTRYQHYGGKGVIVCDAWRYDYQNFRRWALDNYYEDDLTIDRIDNNGDYCPENCRWATSKEQANNQSRNRILKYKDKTMTMSQWADYLDITYGTMNSRIQRKWSMERIVNTPIRKRLVVN